ncbi:MAG: ATP-binding protein [Rhodoferax sp.]|nr:ATP-binding protein [Rhodoferax sp.]
MIEELSRLLAVNGYIPHGYCLSWSPTLVFTFVVSDLLIFLSYFSMPLALIYFARKRQDFPYRWLLWLFSAFIMACGATHLMGVVVLWQPMYGLDALLKAITAVISVGTAIALWPLLPHALKRPSPTQWRRANEALQREIGQRRQVENALRVANAQAEENLQRKVLLLAAIVESCNEAVIGKTLDGTIATWNRAAEKIFGYSAQQMIGQSASRLIPPERLHEEHDFLACVLHGESIFQFETQRVRQDGALIDVTFTVSPILDEKGHVCGASIVASDITERKRAHAELQRISQELRMLNQTLEARVTERTAELAQANALLAESGADLQRSNRELEQFAYVASHDLQEPLRMVVGFVQLLEKRLADKLDSETSEFMAFAVDGALRMQKLIQDILTYSRVSNRGAPPATVDSALAVTDALVLLGNKVTDSGTLVQAEGLPLVRADRTQLVQLFQNLIGNAIKFCRDGAPKIQIQAVRQGAQWRFSMTDNGIGIAQEYRERVFGIFQRLHTRQEYEGTGIGLAICKRIVERHGGTIGVEAASGGGSTFWFTLDAEPST